jgi:hypothetical protein
MKAKDARAILAAEEERELQRQTEDRRARLTKIRRAGDESRRRDRERKAKLGTQTTAILAAREPGLRKRVQAGASPALTATAGNIVHSSAAVASRVCKRPEG